MGIKEDFWNETYENLDRAVQSARSEGRTVSGLSAFVHLVVSPAFTFVRSFFLSPNIARARQGLKNAVHESLFLFAVNARLYELEKGDRAPVEKIREEWDKIDSPGKDFTKGISGG